MAIVSYELRFDFSGANKYYVRYGVILIKRRILLDDYWEGVKSWLHMESITYMSLVYITHNSPNPQ